MIEPVKRVDEVQVQFGIIVDSTFSMNAAISAATRGLEAAGNALLQLSKSSIKMAVIAYHDYGDAKKNIEPLLDYTGKHLTGARPIFTTPEEAKKVLERVKVQGGDDEPEMFEAALAMATQLPWESRTAPDEPIIVKTIYMAFDALPHAHREGIDRGGVHTDNFNTLEKIKAEQNKLQVNDPYLSKADHAEDWITQLIVLVKKGILINPMICADDPELVFFAAFMAYLSGGSAIFIDNSQWENNLEDYIKDTAGLYIEELKNWNKKDNNSKGQIQGKISELNKKYAEKISVPSAEVYKKVEALVLKIEEHINNPKLSTAYKIAQKVRLLYEKAVSEFILEFTKAQRRGGEQRAVRPGAIISDISEGYWSSRRQAALERGVVYEAPPGEKQPEKLEHGYFLDEITITKQGTVFLKFEDSVQAKNFVEKFNLPPVRDPNMTGGSLPQPDGKRCQPYWVVRVSARLGRDGVLSTYDKLREKISSLPEIKAIKKEDSSFGNAQLAGVVGTFPTNRGSGNPVSNNVPAEEQPRDDASLITLKIM